MYKEYVLRINLINMVLRFMVTFTISSIFILLFTGDDALIWKALILFPISLVSFIIERYTRNIWIYLVLHIALFIGCICITENMVLKIAFAMFVFIFASLQYAVTNITLPFTVSFLMIYLIAGYLYPNLNQMRQFFLYMAIAFCLCYLLNNYYINFYTYFQDHKEKTNIPIRLIKSSNRFMITGFLTICFLVMMAFSEGPLAGILRSIGVYAKELFRMRINHSAPMRYASKEEIMERTALQHGVSPTGLPEFEPTKFMVITANIACVLFLLFLIVIIVRYLVKKFYKFYQFYYKRKVPVLGEDLVEIALPIEKKRSNIFGKREGSEKGFFNRFGVSNNVRIRKHYAKAVYKNASLEKGLKYKTPSQLSEYAISGGEQSSDLTALYEKARYSNEDCSREEVQRVKNLLK